jgi:4-hydroxy-2-oxoheptanedioate aldolase
VSNASAIAAVQGVDVVFVGPNDLAHTMGHENRWTDAPVQAAMEQVIRATHTAGKCPGVLGLTPEEESRYAGWGARYFANVTTSLFTQALQRAARGEGSGPARY